jgi:hypothetical protein
MQHHTEQERINHVSAFMESGLTKIAYSEKHDIPMRTLVRWCGKYKSAEIDDAKLAHLTLDKHFIKKSTLHYDADGKLKQMWLKTDKKLEDTLAIMKTAAAALCKDITPTAPIEYKNHSLESLLSLYVTTDYHFGMLAMREECGEDWTLDIAKTLLVNWYREAIASAPDSHTGILLNLGDMLHTDGLEAVTPTSGHSLDADARYQVVVNVLIDIFREIVSMMLEKHEHVHIVMAEGNHDIAGSVWLRAMFQQFYKDEPRITVDNTHIPYYAYQWGKVSLFFHHGHKKRMDGITEALMGAFRKMVGETIYSYVHMGHMHHKHTKENTVMIVEQHTTLSAKDAHSVRGGYSSKRSASVITYHKDHGEVSRSTITPEMVM